MTQQIYDRTALENDLRRDPLLVEVGKHLGSLECWVVGGWVRDRAVGREPPDLDLVVNGNGAAEQAASLLGTAWKTRPRFLGKPEKAIWRLNGPQCKVEIWPMENGDLQADAHRRDFTCNALFWRLSDGPLIDPTGGLNDIGARRIRAISKDNLTVDPIRLLRSVRLMAILDGFSLEHQTLSWITDLAPTLINAPRERVGAELVALAQAHRAGTSIREGHSLGLLGPSGPLPTQSTMPFTASLDALAQLAGEVCHPVPDAIEHSGPKAILAWLASGWPPGATNALSAFAWPKEIAANVAATVDLLHEAPVVVNQQPPDRREFIARCGPNFPTVMALAAAMSEADGSRAQVWKRMWRQWLRSGQSIIETKPLLSAFEVSSITGVKPGPQLGQMLTRLERATIRREVRTPAGARKWLRGVAEAHSEIPTEPRGSRQ